MIPEQRKRKKIVTLLIFLVTFSIVFVGQTKALIYYFHCDILSAILATLLITGLEHVIAVLIIDYINK